MLANNPDASSTKPVSMPNRSQTMVCVARSSSNTEVFVCLFSLKHPWECRWTARVRRLWSIRILRWFDRVYHPHRLRWSFFPILLSQAPSKSNRKSSSNLHRRILDLSLSRLNNVTVQHSPLSNSNGPMSANSQLLSMSNSTTPAMTNYSSPVNRPVMPSTGQRSLVVLSIDRPIDLCWIGTGSISSPDGETLTLIKYLKENVGRLQIYIQKFTSESMEQ